MPAFSPVPCEAARTRRPGQVMDAGSQDSRWGFWCDVENFSLCLPNPCPWLRAYLPLQRLVFTDYFGL